MTRPELVIIAAVGAESRVIGKGLDLPWRIPEDLKRFKAMTLGHPIIMGRRTFESLVHQFGGPLKNRLNIVLGHDVPSTELPNVVAAHSVDEALGLAGEARAVFIGGGASVYRAFLERVDRLELTLVEGDYEGDVFFPPYEHLIGTMYRETARDERDGYAFVTFERR